MDKELQSLIPSLRSLKIDGEESKDEISPQTLQAIAQLASLAQLVKIRKSLEREQFGGRLDSRTLDATDQRKFLDLIKEWPHIPYATISLINDGPNSVYIALNRRDDEHKIESGESTSADFLKANERISVIYYRCAPGETASTRALGKY